MFSTLPSSIQQGSRSYFALLLLLPITFALLIAFVISGHMAPGWMGVGSEQTVEHWRWWSTVVSLSAATLGIVTLFMTSITVVATSQISRSTRLVTGLSASILVFMSVVALRRSLETNHLLIVSTTALILLLASSLESLGTRVSKILLIQFAVFVLIALLRIGAWWLAWSATKHVGSSRIMLARWCVSGAMILEIVGQLALVLYMISRCSWRGVISVIFGLVFAAICTYWVLSSTLDHQGTLRDALQRALSLRIQYNGPLPIWVHAQNAPYEIALLDSNVRNSLWLSAFLEFNSLALALAAILSVTRASFSILCIMALVVLSRAQVDVPLRAIGLCTAALAALLVSKSTRISTV